MCSVVSPSVLKRVGSKPDSRSGSGVAALTTISGFLGELLSSWSSRLLRVSSVIVVYFSYLAIVESSNLLFIIDCGSTPND